MSDDDGRPSGSAMLVAACRALADELPDHEQLISDPWARHFVDDAAMAAARADVALQRSIRTRTRYIDDRVGEFTALHPGAQVVLLGAGLDARPFRMQVGATWFEVDQPSTAVHRQRLAALHGVTAERRTTLGLDMAHERLVDHLPAAGFDTGSPALVVWEGVVFYLDEASSIRVILDLATLLAPGSRLVFDYVVAPALDDHERNNAVGISRNLRDGGEPLRNGLRDPHATLHAAGFRVIDDEAIEVLAAGYGLDTSGRGYPSRVLTAERA